MSKSSEVKIIKVICDMHDTLSRLDIPSPCFSVGYELWEDWMREAMDIIFEKTGRRVIL